MKFDPGVNIIIGKNGSGKTNILESISLSSPGKGLKSAKIYDLIYKNGDNTASHFDIELIIESIYGNCEILISSKNDNKNIIIDKKPIKNLSELSKIFSVTWITPQMDHLFIGPSADRRKFFDRLVSNFEVNHSSHLSRYNYFLKERSSFFKNNLQDLDWLNILERKIIESAVVIAASRLHVLDMLQNTINDSYSEFPRANITINGEVERMMKSMPSLQVEEYYKNQLISNRSIDKQTGRTNFGIHISDIEVFHSCHNIHAQLCSTGEQKALLISIILAEVRTHVKWARTIPVLLLDEIVAHLDDQKRRYLYDEIFSIDAQTIITSTDASIFEEIKDLVKFISI